MPIPVDRYQLRIAAGRCHRAVGVAAQRPQVGRRIGQADHRQRPRAMLAVEGRRVGHVEAAGHRVLRIVEPEADVERVGGRQINIGIEAEDLIQQDGVDLDMGAALAVGLDIGLLPGHTEVGEVRVGRAVGEQ